MVNHLEVYADPLFEKVFYNLIDIALRYGGKKMTMIRITLQESENGLVIFVNDDGAGISDETTRSAFRESQNRVRVMSHVHEKLYLSPDIAKIDLDSNIRFLGTSLTHIGISTECQFHVYALQQNQNDKTYRFPCEGSESSHVDVTD